MSVPVLTKTEDSIGQAKIDAVPEGAFLDPRYWTSAAQLERMKDALIAHAAAINALGGGGTVGPGNCLFVDPVLGDDGTGARGSAGLPFATLGAALAAVTTSGDCVVLSPGTHSVATTPAMPTVLRYSVIGAGKEATRVVCATNATAFEVLPAGVVGKASVVIAGMTIATGVTDTGILADGTGEGGGYLGAGLVLADVHLEAAGMGLNVSFVNKLLLSNVTCDGSVTVNTCAGLSGGLSVIDGFSIVGDLSITWDDDSADKPGGGRRKLVFQNTQVGGNILVELQPDVLFERGCSAGGMTTNGIQESASGKNAIVWYRGRFVGAASVDFSGGAALVDPTTVAADFQFFDVEMDNGSSIVFEQTGSTVVPTIWIRNLVSVLQGVTVTAKDNAKIWIETDSNPTLVTVGTGAFVMRRYSFTYACAAGANVIAFPVAMQFAPTIVLATSRLAGDVVACTGRAAANVTINSTGGGNVDVLCIWGAGA